MNYIVDTHCLLWILLSGDKLSKTVKTIILDTQNEVWVSVVSLWEISLKYALGKLELRGVRPDDLPSSLGRSGFGLMGLEANTAARFFKLPKLQLKDPFDRMLIWQAIDRGWPMLSKDQAFDEYSKMGLTRIW